METEEIKSKIEENGAFAVRCLMKLYEQQTTDEQNVGATVEYNNVGFNGIDGDILSSFARQVEQWKESKRYPIPLSPKQLALVQKKLPKYAGQLVNLLEQTDMNIQDYEKQNGTSDITIKGKVEKVANPKVYRYNKVKFFMQINSQQHGTVKAMIELDDFEKPSRQLAKIGDVVEIKSRIRDGWANVSLKQHYAVINKENEKSEQEELHNKVEIIRKYLNELKDNDIISTKSYSKVWDAVNEMENEVSSNLSPDVTETVTEGEKKEKETDNTNSDETPPAKHNNRLTDLISEFEG